MKRYYILFLFCLTASFSYACSCAPAASFCEGVYETSIIALVKVTALDQSTATLEKVEALQGEIPASFDINLSSMCPNSADLLELNGKALVNLGMWDDNYSLALCTLGVLPLKNGKLMGQVTANEEDMSYKKFKEKELDCFDESKLLTEDDITIYPNPFVQTLFYTNDYVEIQAVEIYNIKGQLMYEERPVASLFGHIDVPNLPIGIYLVKIYADDQHLTFKVVKGS